MDLPQVILLLTFGGFDHVNYINGKRVVIMVIALDSEADGLGFEPWPGTLFCALWQDTLIKHLRRVEE